MKTTKWKDAIVEEVRKARKRFEGELRRDPEGIMKKALQDALADGYKIAPLKPVKLKRPTSA